VVDRKNNADGSPMVWGGRLSRDANGLRATLLTGRPQQPHPLAMQGLHSRGLQQLDPPGWNGQELTAPQMIYWTGPFKIVCGRCKRSMGRYVAYQAGAEYGIVEHTSREYVTPQLKPGGNDPHVRLTHERRRYWLSGTQADTSRTTFVHVRCSRCNKTYERNMGKLAFRLFPLRPEREVFDDYLDPLRAPVQ